MTTLVTTCPFLHLLRIPGALAALAMLAWTCGSGRLNAAAAAYEDFGIYSNGAVITNTKLPAAGAGFKMWDGHKFIPKVEAGNVWYIDAQGQALAAAGKRLNTLFGGIAIWATLDTTGVFTPWLRPDSLIGKSDTTLYLSLAIQFEGTSGAGAQLGHQLVNGAINGQDPANPAVFKISQDWGASELIAAGQSNRGRAVLGPLDTDPHLVVVKFAFAEGNDTITVWYDPILGQPEGQQTPVTTITGGDVAFDKWWIKGQGNTSFLDEVRWGATFEDVTPISTKPLENDLTVEIVGPGTVELTPPGGTYPIGTEVTLRAVPAANSLFSTWEGALTGPSLVRTLVMDDPRTVRAIFHTIVDQPEITVTIDPTRTYQTIDGWGTNVYGDNASAMESSLSFRQFVAQDLGFTILRVELAPEVTPNEIATPADIDYRNFVISPGSRMEGQLRFYDSILTVNPNVKIIGTVWSPPGWMKESGKSAGTKAGYLLDGARTYDLDNRLRDDRYDHMARWLVEWARFFESRGTPLYAIGPQNELMFTEPYNSCLYNGEEFALLVRKTGQLFAQLNVTKPLFYGPEDMTGFPGRQAMYFNALMEPDTAPFFDVFASHGYVDGVATDTNPDSATGFWNAIKNYNRRFWVTEGGSGGVNWPEPLDGMASMMHNLLVGGNASAFTPWQFNDIISGTQANLKTRVTQHYWGHLKPGAVRLDAKPAYAASNSLMSSAFWHEQDKVLTVVIVNRQQDNQPVVLDLGADVGFSQWQVWRTAATRDAHTEQEPLVLTDGRATLTLPAETIVTLEGHGELVEGHRGAEQEALALFENATLLNQRFLWHPALDFAYVRHTPFIYSMRHGWLWATGTEQAGLFLYDWRLGWLHLSQTTGDWLYHFSSAQWLQWQNGAAPERVFLRQAGGTVAEAALLP